MGAGASALGDEKPTIQVLYDIFNSIDKNHDGGISYSEFGRVMTDSDKVSGVSMEDFMGAAALDRTLTWDEFITMLLERQLVTEEDMSVFKWARIEDIFNTLDADKSGTVSLMEWKFTDDFIVRTIIKDIDFKETAGEDKMVSLEELEEALVKRGKILPRKKANPVLVVEGEAPPTEAPPTEAPPTEAPPTEVPTEPVVAEAT